MTKNTIPVLKKPGAIRQSCTQMIKIQVNIHYKESTQEYRSLDKKDYFCNEGSVHGRGDT